MTDVSQKNKPFSNSVVNASVYVSVIFIKNKSVYPLLKEQPDLSGILKSEVLEVSTQIWQFAWEVCRL